MMALQTVSKGSQGAQDSSSVACVIFFMYSTFTRLGMETRMYMHKPLAPDHWTTAW